MTCLQMTNVERAQLAMMLEVCAYPKPGNVDRCHDYPETRLEHFLASTILARPSLEEADRGEGRIGEIIKHAVRDTNCHTGGNTHFGAFILLIPLIYGKGIPGAIAAIAKTDSSDAVGFYKAFSMTSVKMHETDELDVNDPHTLTLIRERDMNLLDIMQHSAANDMVAREWVTGFPLVRRGADLLKELGPGRQSIVDMFLTLLATEPDTFIIKKHGLDVAREIMLMARDVLDGKHSLVQFDEDCIQRDINPGSIADITIAAIYLALGEGWSWDS
jgi:triphosphoribosyl-dephospho-CoA synthase